MTAPQTDVQDADLATSAEGFTGLKPAPKTLFSAMKNEAPFILEWVAYHRAIGFDEIVICSNPSTDGTEDILAALADAGEIRHLRAEVPPGQSPQGVAAKLFSETVGYVEGGWYLWLDADEFLNIHAGRGTVDDLIAALGDHQCLLVNWRIFGSSGHARFPGRFVAAAFTGASDIGHEGNLEVKSLFRKSREILGFAPVGIHRPLISRTNRIDLRKVLTGSGTSMDGNRRRNRLWRKGDSFGRTNLVDPDECGWKLAQINHYIVRTPEFFALKRLRGRGWKADSVGEKNRRHTDDFFLANDRNEQEDRSILRWEAAVSDEIHRLRRLPLVGPALARSQELVAEALEKVSDQAPTAPAAVSPPAAKAAEEFQLTFPETEADFVRQHYRSARNILEYGSGGSTVLAATLGARVVSVESDLAWANRLSTALAPFGGRARVHHVDIGPTGAWGKPVDTSGAASYHRYALSVWDLPDLGTPDLVLIDGRFRAACLAAVLLRARQPTTVLFDDYADRPYYKAVEKLAVLEEQAGRMARFTVTPGQLPADMLTEVVGWFSDMR